ncbi:MAG: 50S ribosomal protein L4 [Candidatus Diapherotrites archaeon]|nr:50S ribosomal protein L4 [Candidatus Diapherotrites archaeon]
MNRKPENGMGEKSEGKTRKLKTKFWRKRVGLLVFFMRADVFSIEGKKLHEVELPTQFSADVDRGLIKRAVLSIQSAAIQPKGAFAWAGRLNTARYRGRRDLPGDDRSINVGRSRLPRLRNRGGRLRGKVARVPQAVGGPQAHPLKAEKTIIEEINKKEKRAATASAIAASAKRELVVARHVLAKDAKLPVIVEDKIEAIGKTKQLVGVLSALGLAADIDNAKGKRRRRAGKGKKRGRIFKQKKSILIVTRENAAVFKAGRNLSGVDVCVVRNLNAALLAPGTVPGRLVLWSEGAIKALGEKPKKEAKSVEASKDVERKVKVAEAMKTVGHGHAKAGAVGGKK